jgi:hypothetical protein
MLSDDQTTSFAGTWGKTIKLRTSSPGRNRRNDYQTTFSSSFSADKFSTLTKENQNRFTKFVSGYLVLFCFILTAPISNLQRTMRMSGNAVMDSQKSKQSHDLIEEPTRFDNSATLVSRFDPL